MYSKPLDDYLKRASNYWARLVIRFVNRRWWEWPKMDGHARSHHDAWRSFPALWRSNLQASSRVCDWKIASRWLAQLVHRHLRDWFGSKRSLSQPNLQRVCANVASVLLALKWLTVFATSFINCLHDSIAHQELSADHLQLAVESRHACDSRCVAHPAWRVRRSGPNRFCMVNRIRNSQIIKLFEFAERTFRHCNAELAFDLKTWRIYTAQRFPFDY